MPKISVIVPVYNSQKELPACIDSILAQTLSDFELILIDDGSVDESGELCDQYHSRDDRIRVIHQENAGVSAARNAGLDVAIGEYITFCDSDDYVEKDWLKRTVREFERDMVRLVVCGEKLVDSNGKLIYDEKIDSQILKCSQFYVLSKMQMIGHVCNKMFLTAVIQDNHIRFLEDRTYWEDKTFVFDYLDCLTGKEEISIVGRKLYVYRYDADTVSLSKNRVITNYFYIGYELSNQFMELGRKFCCNEKEYMGIGSLELYWLTMKALKNIVFFGKGKQRITELGRLVRSEEFLDVIHRTDIAELLGVRYRFVLGSRSALLIYVYVRQRNLKCK